MVPVKLELLLRGIAEVPYADETVTEVVTDSRKAGPGKVFVAMIKSQVQSISLRTFRRP